MTKYNFLNELERRLAKLPEEDRKEIIQDYKEHFEFATEAGKSDEEIIASLGSPEKIAKEVTADYHVEMVRQNKGFSNVVRAIFAVGGLGLLNLIFVLGPTLATGGVIFSFLLVGVVSVVSPVLLLIFSAIGLQSFTWFDFFMSLMFSGVGIFLSIAAYYMTKWAIALTARYLAFNLRVVKGDKG